MDGGRELALETVHDRAELGLVAHPHDQRRRTEDLVRESGSARKVVAGRDVELGHPGRGQGVVGGSRAASW